MLSVVEKKKEIDEAVFKELLDKIAGCDGFIVVSIEKGKVQWNRYQLDDAETLYLLEWAKIRLMTDAGI